MHNDICFDETLSQIQLFCFGKKIGDVAMERLYD